MARESKFVDESKGKQDDFFADLDQYRHRPSMSCGTLVFFLFFLLVTCGYIVYWGVVQIKTKVETENVTISQAALNGAESKLQKFLGNSESAGQPVDISLTDQELSSLLVKNELLAETDKFSVRNPEAIILPEGLEIHASLVKPIKSQIVAQTKPVIVNGKLKLEVHDVKAGKLTIPKYISGGLSGLLERLVTDRLNRDNLIYDKVVLGEHLMTVSGRTR